MDYVGWLFYAGTQAKMKLYESLYLRIYKYIHKAQAEFFRIFLRITRYFAKLPNYRGISIYPVLSKYCQPCHDRVCRPSTLSALPTASIPREKNEPATPLKALASILQGPCRFRICSATARRGKNRSNFYFILGIRRKKFPNSNPKTKSAPTLYFSVIPAISRPQTRLSNITACTSLFFIRKKSRLFRRLLGKSENCVLRFISARAGGFSPSLRILRASGGFRRWRIFSGGRPCRPPSEYSSRHILPSFCRSRLSAFR